MATVEKIDRRARGDIILVCNGGRKFLFRSERLQVCSQYWDDKLINHLPSSQPKEVSVGDDDPDALREWMYRFHNPLGHNPDPVTPKQFYHIALLAVKYQLADWLSSAVDRSFHPICGLSTRKNIAFTDVGYIAATAMVLNHEVQFGHLTRILAFRFADSMDTMFPTGNETLTPSVLLQIEDLRNRLQGAINLASFKLMPRIFGHRPYTCAVLNSEKRCKALMEALMRPPPSGQAPQKSLANLYMAVWGVCACNDNPVDGWCFCQSFEHRDGQGPAQSDEDGSAADPSICSNCGGAPHPTDRKEMSKDVFDGLKLTESKLGRGLCLICIRLGSRTAVTCSIEEHRRFKPICSAGGDNTWLRESK
ncbi:hypothetical protein ANO11243_083560 [Dothideomycetidae sp. 11243]|nr:hypothetical protein ANO11243_083560 [fungal sp. No.11243]